MTDGMVHVTKMMEHLQVHVKEVFLNIYSTLQPLKWTEIFSSYNPTKASHKHLLIMTMFEDDDCLIKRETEMFPEVARPHLW